MLNLRFFFLFSFAALPMAFANQSPSEPLLIHWVLTSTAPTPASLKINVVDENHDLFKLYKNGLPEYEHEVTKGTVPRIEAELKNKKLACFPGSSEANRRRQFAYLTPQYIQPSPQLVATPKTAKYLKRQFKNGVALKDVLKDTSLRGMIGESRSYGSAIDSLLNAGPNNIRKGVFETFGPNLMNMLEKGRADYTIEYPFILEFLRKSSNTGVDLVRIPLTDTGATITQYLACSKTPEGLAVIKRADEIIRKHVKEPSYWTRVLDSVPEHDRHAFQKEINAFSESRAKAPAIIE